MHVLMIRHAVETKTDAPVTFTNGLMKFTQGSETEFHPHYRCFIGGLNNGTDHTSFDHLRRQHAERNGLVNGSIIGAVQFLTARGVIIGMTTGDSHHLGTGTTSGFRNFLWHFPAAMGTAGLANTSFGWAVTAMGGVNSQHFFRSFLTLLPAVRPSFVVLPGWSYNDTNGSVHSDEVAASAFLARLFLAADAVRDAGALPVWLTPFPRNPAAMTQEVLAVWQSLRATLLAKRDAGEVVVDAASVLSVSHEGGLKGTYRSEFTTDNVHPNDEGHAAVASCIARALREYSRGSQEAG